MYHIKGILRNKITKEPKASFAKAEPFFPSSAAKQLYTIYSPSPSEGQKQILPTLQRASPAQPNKRRRVWHALPRLILLTECVCVKGERGECCPVAHPHGRQFTSWRRGICIEKKILLCNSPIVEAAMASSVPLTVVTGALLLKDSVRSVKSCLIMKWYEMHSNMWVDWCLATDSAVGQQEVCCICWINMNSDIHDILSQHFVMNLQFILSQYFHIIY